MKKLLLILICLIVSFEVKSNNWAEILEIDKGISCVDMDNIKRDNDIVNFYLKVNFREKSNGKKVSSNFLCKGRSNTFGYKRISSTFFEGFFSEKIINRYGSDQNFSKGICLAKVVEVVCDLCNTLHNIYHENTGKKLDEYECEIDFFKNTPQKNKFICQDGLNVI